MNLYLRLLIVLLKVWLRPRRLEPLGTSVLRFRVLPTDLDLNLHMNNGRYLTLMDLGRVDLMLRLGLGRVVFKERWMPVIASALVRFRRSLEPFQSFELHTRLLAWDEKWFFIEQRVVREGRTVTLGLIKGAFRSAGGVVPPAQVIDRVVGHGLTSPPMPEAVRSWQASEDQLKNGD